MTGKLTEKQRRFVEAYLLDPNATRAAIAAGYSEKTAHSQGPRLLENVEVQAALDAARQKREEKTGVDAAWVLERLALEATADIADLYDENTNTLKPVHEWPLIWRQGLIAGIEINELFEGRGDERVQIGYVSKLKLSDKIKRVELLGKHVRVNAFQDVVQHKGLDGLADRLARAKKRKKGE